MAITYFDPSYLKSYIQSGLTLDVYVDGMYLTVPSTQDLDKLVDSKKGTGYIEGKPVKFDYRDIDHLKIGSITFSKDLLNKDQDVAKKGEEGVDDSDTDSDVDDTEDDTKDLDSIEK